MNIYYFSNQSNADFKYLIHYLGYLTIKRNEKTDSGEPPSKRQCLEIYDIQKDKIEWKWGLFNENDIFEYEGHSLNFKMIQNENSPKISGFGSDIICHKTIILETIAPIEIVNKFLIESRTHYDSIYNQVKKQSLSYCIYDASKNQWNHIGSIEPRDVNSVYIPKKDMNKLINIMDNHRDEHQIKRLSELDIPRKKIYLFEGVWGSGKTTTIRMLASKYKVPLYVIPFSPSLNDEKLIKAIDSVPSEAFIVLEDIDTMFLERKKGDEHKNNLTFSGLLNALDGIYYKNGREIFMTTNYKSCLDPALIRPGRIDFVLTFKYAVKEQILQMFQRFTNPSEEQIEMFWKKYQSLKNCHLTMATLQQYLQSYIDMPNEAIENINELKKLIDKTTQSDNSKHLFS